ncbi:UNVERIFIED_CONTAM: hypothetical protein GTU68_013262 [Idotea baltica]|nr:hypothetical protein [Idotea baltica]
MRDSKTLMLNRNKRDADVHKGKWNGLGGKFESGETPEECVSREVLEESGLKIESPQLAGLLSFPKFQDERDWYVYVFTAEEFSGSMSENDEGSLSWIDNSDVLTLELWEGDKIFLPWLFEKRFFSAMFKYEDGRLVDHSVSFYSLQS